MTLRGLSQVSGSHGLLTFTGLSEDVVRAADFFPPPPPPQKKKKKKKKKNCIDTPKDGKTPAPKLSLPRTFARSYIKVARIGLRIYTLKTCMRESRGFNGSFAAASGTSHDLRRSARLLVAKDVSNRAWTPGSSTWSRTISALAIFA